jgi:polysaccharide chain length determinant protein (PEP-CTERM system associated)
MQGAQSSKAFELVDVVLRSWWTLVAGVCIGLAAAVIALHYAPKKYEASTKIFMAQPKIPTEYVRSVVTDDTALRLAAVKEAVLSRPYMLRLIESTFGMPDTEEGAENLMNDVRGRMDVKVLPNLFVFVLSYRDSDPKRAANVVNTLADLYTKQNAQFRAEQAKETTQTLEGFAYDARSELQAKDKLIADFKARHLYDTAEQLQANLQLHASRQKDLEANSRALAAAQERLQMLKAQQAAAASGAAFAGPGANVDPYTARLAQVQRELDALRARYSDDHPDVRSKARELQDLMSNPGQLAAADDKPGSKSAGSGRPMTPLEAQIRGASREVATLEAEAAKIRREISVYQSRIESTPRVEQELAELTKGYDVLLQQYKSYEEKAGSARGSQVIEENQKGQQFEVIERAVPPSRPVEPVPLVVFGLGLVGGLLAFVGPVVARALIHPVVQSELGLAAVSDVPILVAIPRIPTPELVRSAERARYRNVGLSALSATVLAAAIAFLLL